MDIGKGITDNIGNRNYSANNFYLVPCTYTLPLPFTPYPLSSMQLIYP
jgi:hypothetical protein